MRAARPESERASTRAEATVPREERLAAIGGEGVEAPPGFDAAIARAEGKANVVGMVMAVEESMHQNLENLAWMDEPTRKAAFGKLGKIANKIAYPDKWRSYDGLAISRES